MDTLVQTALVGTTRQPDGDTMTGTPVDTLMGRQDGLTPERRLLLAAGARAVYRLAGQLPNGAPALPEACPAETHPFCPPGAAQVVSTLLAEPSGGVLIEALERLAHAGYVLPHDLLVRALATRDARTQAALRPVLGKRGRWLARQNPAWAWATADPTDDLPADAEQIWQEGAPAERLDVFGRLRRTDPARAREWLAAVWSGEKAEMRGDLLGLLAINLSAEDTAALEMALSDRAASVRAVARPLLARLPESAFTQRMLERADALLTCERGTLKLALPRRLDDAWKSDGIQEQPPQGRGKRAWWALQVLSLIPPAHWQTQLQRTPAGLLAALPADDAPVIVESWSRAALLHEDGAWMAPLWDWWRHLPARPRVPASENVALLLFARMPLVQAERRVLRELTEQPAGWDEHLPHMLMRLPTPWSARLARTYLEELRARIQRLMPNNASWSDPYIVTMEPAVLGIPPDLSPYAPRPTELPGPRTPIIRHWADRLASFTRALGLRQRLYEEIPE